MPKSGNKKKIVLNLSGPARAQRRRASQNRRKSTQVVAVIPSQAGTARNPRRRRNRRRNRGTLGLGGSKQIRNTFDFTVKSFNGNAGGTMKFGPNLAESKLFKTMVDCYQKYRVTAMRVIYTSEASSTDRGCISYHVDTGCSMTTADLTATNSWPLRESGSANFGGNLLGDVPWYESGKEQFWLVYKGSGDANVAGHMRVIFSAIFMNPQ
nr:coat protein [Carrot enamovirus 1]